MSDITQYITASQISHASQTHERLDKSTHANLTVFKKAPTRLYGKYKLVHGFKDIHPDPEIDKLIEELGSLLDGALSYDSREEFPESEPVRMHFPGQATALGGHKIPYGRGTKRPFSECGLETIFEHHEHTVDVGTDPMPATYLTDKETQVFEEEFIHFAMEREQLISVKQNATPRCKLIIPSPSKPFFKVFSDKMKGFATQGRNHIDPWAPFTSGDTLQRRPVLATRDGAHPDALSRLRTLHRYVVNVQSVLNRGLRIPTYNEFPFTREHRRNTLRFRTGMIRQGSIIGLGTELLSQEQINEYVQANRNHPRRENPFDSVVRPRRSVHAPAIATQDRPQFWQRLGICTFVPRIWIYSRRPTGPTLFTRGIPPFRRIFGERS